MPSNFPSIDTDFPTFTGDESEREQIQALVNYLYQFRESLLYALQNLSKKNFNTAALNTMEKEVTQGITEDLDKIKKILSLLDTDMQNLQREFSDAEKNITDLKDHQIVKIQLVEV